MAVSSLAPSGSTVVTALRRDWFSEHVPWHRVRTVVDVTHDGGRLMAEILTDFVDTSALVIDLNGNLREVREQVGGLHDRVKIKASDVLADLPLGADYYLLPDHLEDLDVGRLSRLLQSVSRACLPSGRALACVPEGSAATVIQLAERAGLEVTRLGGSAEVSLIEFGSGPLRVLPTE